MRVNLMAAAAAALALLVGATTSAEARRHRHVADSSDWGGYSSQRSTKSERRQHRRHRGTDYAGSYSGRSERAGYGGYSVGARPGKWCGWWMRTQLGGGPEFNVAANWRRYGSATSPQVGAVVVWPHHVGIITGRASNGQWIVKSGNDGGQVRERARSVSGASFRI